MDGVRGLKKKCAAVQAADQAARLGAPVGRAQAGQRRHDGHAAGIGHRCRQGLDVGGGLDDAQPVAQPLHESARDKGAAFQGIAGSAGGLPGHRTQQAVLREHRLVAHEGGAAGRERQRRMG